MSDSSGKEDHEPRWDIIEKLHDKIDGDISEALRVNRMSFIEIDIALLMVSEKIAQQKMELYNLYMKQEGNPTENAINSSKDKEETDAPTDLYK
jgi:hypothetical protein|tara:strand:+ start:3394 stop:3675 length:282 start_codon:yes stop_codon:yes gene_type:complete